MRPLHFSHRMDGSSPVGERTTVGRGEGKVGAENLSSRNFSNLGELRP
jgi:hypothetical protein